MLALVTKATPEDAENTDTPKSKSKNEKQMKFTQIKVDHYEVVHDLLGQSVQELDRRADY